MVAAAAATNLDTIVGHIQWNGANLPPFAAKNVCKTPLVGGQWRLKSGGGYDLVVTDNRDGARDPDGRQDGADRLNWQTRLSHRRSPLDGRSRAFG